MLVVLGNVGNIGVILYGSIIFFQVMRVVDIVLYYIVGGL